MLPVFVNFCLFFLETIFKSRLFYCLQAIELDGSNPVFYCNRAAAHSKMNAHHLAIEDCQRAIDMDPNYSKENPSLSLVDESLSSLVG
jgi:hypothetical protein